MRVETPLSSVLLVLLASVIGSFGAVFLKLGAEPLRKGLKYIVNWKLAFGVALYVGSSIPFVMGVRHGELSVLYPMVSVGYVCTMFWSRLFFGEPITMPKLGALAVIVAGIVCINIGGR
ncbi:MAG: permease [Bryobacterales bacterium]|nr:permease [Bryobacterales bacterium]